MGAGACRALYLPPRRAADVADDRGVAGFPLRRDPSYVEPPYNAFTILRPKFDRWFAAQAEAAGAFLLTSTVVDDVIIERGRVVGVKVRRDEGEAPRRCGHRLRRRQFLPGEQAGLQRELKTHEVSLGVKEVLGLDEAVIRERFHLSGNEGMVLEYVGAVTDMSTAALSSTPTVIRCRSGSSARFPPWSKRRSAPTTCLRCLRLTRRWRPWCAAEVTRILGAPDPRKRLGDDAEAGGLGHAGGGRCRRILPGYGALHRRDQLRHAIRYGGR